MKRILFTFFVMCFLLSTTASAKIKWADEPLRDVLVRAKVLEKPVMIELYATWCSTCIKLEDEVFKKDAGEKLSDRMLCLQYDAEKGKGLELAKKYNVISYPTVIILDKDGNEIDRILDYEKPSSFIKKALNYASRQGAISSIEDHLKEKPKDIEMLFKAGEKYAFRGNERKANEYLGKLIEIDPRNKKGYSDKALYTLAAYLYIRGQKNYDKAMPLLNELENQYPDSPYAKKADLERAKVYLKTNEKKKALNSLNNYLVKNRSTTSGKPQNAYAWFCFKNNFHMKEGLEVAKKGIELNPRSSSLYDTLAGLHSALGQHDKAVSAIRKALELEPGDTYYEKQLEKFKEKRDKSRKKS